MSAQITLAEARAYYEKLDAVQRHLLADAFSEAFKAKLRDGMSADELQDAADAAFIDAVRAISGNT